MSSNESNQVGGDNYDKNLQDENIKIANRIAMERALRIDEAARKLIENKGNIEIRFRIPNGEQVNPFGQKETIYRNGEFVPKTFTFRKIATGDWNLYITKRAELQTEMMKPADIADQNKIADLSNRIHEYLALKYLGVPHIDYIRADWDDMKLAIEACNHITENANMNMDTTILQDKPKHFMRNLPAEPIMKMDITTPQQPIDEDTIRLNKRTTPEVKPQEGSSSKKYYEYEG